MPCLTYRCPECSHEFEKIFAVYTDSPQECPKCGEIAEQVPAVPSPFQWKSGYRGF